MRPFIVQLTQNPGEPSELSKVHNTLWEELQSFLSHYFTASPAIEDIFRTTTFEHDQAIDPDNNQLRYWFDEEDERADLAHAWLRLGLAAGLYKIDSAVSGCGWWIESPRDDLHHVFQQVKDTLADNPIAAMMGPSEQFAETIAENFHTPTCPPPTSTPPHGTSETPHPLPYG